MTGLRRIFLWAMVASLALDALVGIAALLLPRYGPEEEVLGSAALFAAFSLLALLCAVVLGKRRLEPLMWGGIGCSAAALLAWLVLIWFDRHLGWGEEDMLARVGSTLTASAILIVHCGLMSLLPLVQPWARGVRVATCTIAASLCASIVLLIWTRDFVFAFVDEDDIFRFFGVLVILTLCGTVVTPILWKVQAARRGPAESIPSRVRLSLTCPRCGRTQSLGAGRGACAGCGLRIEINVEEPRCACGYLLHTLKGDRCPECGREIPAADRWIATAP